MLDYVIINSKEELERIISQVEADSFYTNQAFTDFVSDSHRTIYAHFGYKYFVFGETRTPNDVENTQKTGIFETLKLYGSSKSYKGVVDASGNIIISPMFKTIEPFWNNLIKVGRNKKYGIYNLNGDMICPVDYDDIYGISEFVFGVRKNDKIGFMDTSGNIVIPLNYDYPLITDNLPPFKTPQFYNGLACMYKNQVCGNEGYGYIDHYGNEVFPFIFDFCIEFDKSEIENFTTKTFGDDYRHDKYLLDLNGSMQLLESEYIDTFRYSDYECSLGSYYDKENDILDAYEGDESNMWNTD